MKKTDEQVTEKNCECDNCHCGKAKGHGRYMGYRRRAASTGGSLYGFGFIGALVYYLSTAASFGVGLIGILKALVWPAFLVYELMKFLHM